MELCIKQNNITFAKDARDVASSGTNYLLKVRIHITDPWKVIGPYLRFSINAGITEKRRIKRVSIHVRSGAAQKIRLGTHRQRVTNTGNMSYNSAPLVNNWKASTWLAWRTALAPKLSYISKRFAPGGTTSSLVTINQGRDSIGRWGKTARCIVARVQIKIQCVVDASKSRNVKPLVDGHNLLARGDWVRFWVFRVGIRHARHTRNVFSNHATSSALYGCVVWMLFTKVFNYPPRISSRVFVQLF